MRKGEMMHKILGIALVLSVMLGTLGGTGWADNVRAEAAGTVEPHNECVVFTLEAKTAMAGISVCAAALTENSANATISNEMVLDDVSTPTAATTYTVHPTDPSADFTTIQAAVDAASPGDNIEVWNSTYGEHITVNKQLSIYSRDGAAVTLVDGSDVGSCFYVTANGVSITGFTVQNGEYGIRLCDSNYSTVTENTVRSNNNYGISLRGGCVFTEISDNMVTSNQGHGIYMDGGANNNLIGNTVTSNDDHGIYLWASDENEVANNTIEFNDSCGIHLYASSENNILTENSINYNGSYGLYISSPRNYIAQSNVVNGEHIYHFYKEAGTLEVPIVVEGLTLTGVNVINQAKITLCDCQYVIVRNNTVQNSGSGILLSASSYNEINDNSIALTDYGIYLDGSSNNKVTGNEANVDEAGICLASSSENNELDNNTLVSFNDYALRADTPRNYISQTNIANSEHIYHFYNEHGTEESPIIVEGLTLTGADVTSMGKITICQSTYVTARDNVLRCGGKGILVDSSQAIKMLGNQVSDNDGDGIYLTNSDYNELLDNEVSDNDGSGIRLYYSKVNAITGNTACFNHNDGIWLDHGDLNEISGNTITSNGARGIFMYYSDNNNLIGNTVTSNDDNGIYLAYGDENEVANNTIEFNDSCGIHVDAENNILTENSISHNGDYGIYMWGDNNLFYNNYVNNAKNAAASGTHYWNITKTEGTNIIGGPYLGGNYWSDYTGEDLDGDGLGDTELPYNSGGSIANGGDYLPLVLPGAINIVYLKPEDSCAPFCCTRDVEIRVNATDFQAGQIKLVYNSSCADVSDWVRNEDDFPLGTWDSDIPGEELITFSSLEPLTGDYPIGTLSIHCVSEEERATALDFVEDGATGSALFDNTGSEMPAIWEDGTFECVLRICGDVAPLPCCDGIVNMGDVVLLLNYVGHPSEYQLCCDWSGDVAPCPASDGTINMGDVVLLLNYVGHPGEYQLCCE